MLIGHGTAATSALAIANRMLGLAGGVHGLTRTTVDDLTGVPGIGRVVACRVLAAVELGRRTLVRRPRARDRILSAQDAAVLLLPQFGAHPVERFGVLLLDSAPAGHPHAAAHDRRRRRQLGASARGLSRGGPSGRDAPRRVPQSPVG